MTNTAGIPGDRICAFVERVERIDEEIKALNEGKKEVFAEAMADDSHQIALSARFCPENAEAVLRVVEGDPLNEAGENFLGR